MMKCPPVFHSPSTPCRRAFRRPFRTASLLLTGSLLLVSPTLAQPAAQPAVQADPPIDPQTIPQPAPPEAAVPGPLPESAQVVAMDREAPYQFVLAKMLTAEGEMGAAGSAFREALERAPDEPYLRLEYASYLIRLASAARGPRSENLLQQARREAERARELAGDEPAVWRTLAEVYYDLARNDPSLQADALQALERVVEAEPEDLESSLTLGQLYLSGDQPEKAAKLFSRVAERTSGNRFVYSLLGEALMRTGRMAEAEEVLGRLLALDPSSRQVRLGLAGLLSERGDHAGALEVLEQAPRGLRQQEDVQRRIALELLFSGRPDEAREQVEALYAAEPEAPPVLAARALVLAAQGESEELDRMVADLPPTDSRRRELAALLSQQGEGAAAERLLRATLGRLEAPGAPSGDEPERTAAAVRFQLAELLSERGDAGTAADLVEPVVRAGELADRRSLTVAWVGYLEQAGRTEEALQRLGALNREDRSDPSVLAVEAALLLGSGQEKEARRLLDRLAETPEGAVRAAQAAQAELRHDLSIPLLEPLAASGEAGSDALFLLGSAYERIGRLDRAEEVFLRLLESDPSYVPAQNYLGYMWVEEGRHLDRALELIRSAVQARPEDGAFLDSLGWAHYKLGEYDLALKYLQRAVRRAPGEPTLHEHLGDVQAALGDVESARRSYRRALELTGTGNADQTAQLERKIEDLRLPLPGGP